MGEGCLQRGEARGESSVHADRRSGCRKAVGRSSDIERAGRLIIQLEARHPPRSSSRKCQTVVTLDG